MLLPGICNLQLPRSTPCLLFVTIQGGGSSPLDLTGWSVKASVSNKGEFIECECSPISSSGKTKITIPPLDGSWEFYEAAIITPDGRIFRILRGEIGLQDSLVESGKHMITLAADLPDGFSGEVTVTGGYLLETESAAQQAKGDAEEVKNAAETVATKAGEVVADRLATDKARTAAEEAARTATDKSDEATRAAKSAKESNVAATASKGAAENACDKAQKWAEEGIDTPVEGEGEAAAYSAKHWASKAWDEATTATTQAVAAKKSAEAASGSAGAAGETKAAVDETKRLIDELYKVMPVTVDLSQAEYDALVAADEVNPYWNYQIVVEVAG